jgi:3-phenylpropionate/trans-cinnamate dioxygenase ferredoxin reductase component
MSGISRIVVLGGGQAGAQAVETLRREGYLGDLVMVSEEPHLPYQRPPLSKKYLSGELTEERLWFHHQSFYDEHQIALRLGLRAEKIEALARAVILSSGERLQYDRLLLCTGSSPRRINLPGSELSGIRYLRGLEDIPAIRSAMIPGARVLIIGGGYIGLETAATAQKLDCQVTVVEMADRVMNRVVAPSVSGYFESEHRMHGVNIVCNMQIERLEGDGGIERVLCADGSCFNVDLIVVGIGAIPNTQLAVEAGLDCDNGIVVDQFCRTSDPAIFAAGDCTNHPSLHFATRVRLESVDNAFEQAKAAAKNMLGRPIMHDRVPWFWSDQFDNKLLVVGLSQGYDQQVLRGDPATRCFSVCYLHGEELLAVEAVNNPKDYIAAGKLIRGRARLRLDRLADPSVALKDTLESSL